MNSSSFLWTIIDICIVLFILLISWDVGKRIIKIYNMFYGLINASEGTFNQIRVAMKKRLDLISQLRQTTEKYSQFERGTFESVTSLRTAVDNAKPEEINHIDSESKTLIGKLFAVVENYPNLKTNTLVIDLMSSIKNVENEIAQHRYKYNKITQEFNTSMDIIPSNIVGRLLGLKKLEYINFEEEISKPQKINT